MHWTPELELQALTKSFMLEPNGSQSRRVRVLHYSEIPKIQHRPNAFFVKCTLLKLDKARSHYRSNSKLKGACHKIARSSLDLQEASKSYKA